jgi:glutathione S-transferase
MLKIYGHIRSHAFRVIWLCGELQIPFEHADVAAGDDTPGIDDDGFALSDPAAISIYLARKHPGRLWPSTIHAEGRMLQWAFFVATDIEPPMTMLRRQRFELPSHQRNPAIADDCERRLLDKAGTLELQLAKTPYFGGIRWDLSDFIVASTLYSLYEMKLDLVQAPKLDRWLTRSVQRPAAREAIRVRE